MPTAPPLAARLLPCARRAMSLIEIMIAIGILGLGLTMVATIFPLALDQHRISTDRILSADVAVQMQSRMVSDSGFLGGLNDGLSGTVYVVPFTTPVPKADGSGTLVDHHISGDLNDLGGEGVPGGSVNNSQPINWRDALYPVPTSSQDLNRRPRYFPVSFYRKTQGVTQCTVFVCRRTGGQRFALQDDGQLPNLAVKPLPPNGDYELVPVPWKIPVTRNSTDARRLDLGGTVPPNPPLTQVVTNGARLVSQPTGSLYTVVQVQDQPTSAIRVLEDTSGEPALTGPQPVFYLWLVPGPFDRTRNTFGNSPVVDVLCFAGPG